MTSTVDAVAGVSPAHTSEPRDAPFRLDRRAAAHLVVAAPAGPEVAALVAAWTAEPAVPLTLLALTGDAAAPAAPDVRTAPAVSGLLGLLGDTLAAAHVGLRVYAAGSEGFVRSAVRVAQAAGMNDDELVATVTGSRARRVWCVHCGAHTQAEEATVRCSGCERLLVAYHHYSRRRGAYLGFSATAEAAPAPAGPVRAEAEP